MDNIRPSRLMPQAHKEQLEQTVDQLNILVFGVDHRASDRVNTDLAEMYHESLEAVYDYAVASSNDTLQHMLQDVPGLIPEDEDE